MTIKDALGIAAGQLQPRKMSCPADESLGWLEAEILMAYVLHMPKAKIIAHANDHLSPTLMRSFAKLVERRRKHEPIAYITGHQEFYGRDFHVNRNTLIPRPESELFIDAMKKRVTNGAVLFWDLGTGSGAIGITLALEFPTSQVIASDISKRAITVAEKNAKRFDVLDRMQFVHADLLQDEIKRLIQKSHLPLYIAANLPYVPMEDMGEIAPDVKDFEPKTAVFAEDHGNQLIKAFLKQIRGTPDVNPELILLEADPDQLKHLKTFAKELMPDAKVKIHKDLAKRDRLLEIDLRA